MATPLTGIIADVEVICTRENLVTLREEVLFRLVLRAGDCVLSDGLAIYKEGEELNYRGD